MKKLYGIPFFIFGFSLFTSSYAQTWDSVGGGLNTNSKYNYYEVLALCVYNGNLIVGGDFDTIQKDIRVVGIAQWNGVFWDTLKTGVEYPSAFLAYNGNLIALGYFPIDESYIGQWDGSNWDTIGTGIQSGAQWTYPYSLCEYAGDLYAGGNFFSNTYCGIAEWNDSLWDSISDGYARYILSPAMAVFNGKLYIGGGFHIDGMNNIATWNDTTLSALGTGVNGAGIAALVVLNGKLYVGGIFDSAGGKPAKNIAVWDGITWSALGSGVSNTVNALTVFNNTLIAGGTFDTAGGIVCNKIAQWDGATWSALGEGIGRTKDKYERVAVNSLCEYNGSLYVGGTFDSAGGILAYNIARWTPAPVTDTIQYYIGTSVSIYPNPSQGVFNIGVPGSGSASIEIYDVLGQEVYSNLLIKGVSNEINLSNESAGVYLYRLLNENGSIMGEGKLIIQK